MLKTSYLRLASEYTFHITSGIAQGFMKYGLPNFFQTYSRVLKTLRNLTLLLVVAGAPYMTQLYTLV